MATTKVEKAGVGFSVGRQGTSVVIEIRPHHDTITSFKGVQIGFELLNGITAEQAKKIAGVLSENVIGVFAVSASDDKAQAATR